MIQHITDMVRAVLRIDGFSRGEWDKLHPRQVARRLLRKQEIRGSDLGQWDGDEDCLRPDITRMGRDEAVGRRGFTSRRMTA